MSACERSRVKISTSWSSGAALTKPIHDAMGITALNPSYVLAEFRRTYVRNIADQPAVTRNTIAPATYPIAFKG